MKLITMPAGEGTGSTGLGTGSTALDHMGTVPTAPLSDHTGTVPATFEKAFMRGLCQEGGPARPVILSINAI